MRGQIMGFIQVNIKLFQSIMEDHDRIRVSIRKIYKHINTGANKSRRMLKKTLVPCILHK